MGTTEMAAFSLLVPFITIVMALSAILSVGSQTLCSQIIGQGNIKKTNQRFSSCTITSLCVSILFTIITVVFSVSICTFLGANEQNAYLMPYMMDYLVIYALGIPGFIGITTLLPMMYLDADQSRALIATLVMAGTNIILDLIMVTIFNGGMFGIALATTISNYIALIVLLCHFLKKDRMLHFTLKGIKVNFSLMQFRFGSVSGIHQIGLSLTSYFTNLLLILMAGEAAFAAHGAVNSASYLITIIGAGIGDTMVIIAGVFFGEEDRTYLKILLKTVLKSTIFVNLGIMIFSIVFAPQIISLFLDIGSEAGALAIHFFKIYALCLVFYSVNHALRNYLLGIAKVAKASLLCVLDDFLCILICAFTLSKFMGIDGIWLSFALGKLIALIIFIGIMSIINKKPIVTWNDLLFLDPKFGETNNDKLEITVTSMEEIMNFSQTAYDFCIRKNSDKETADLIVLCFKELAGNVIQHGFCDSKQHSLDLRLIKKEKYWFIRLRDDCFLFNPIHEYEKTLSASGTKNTKINIIFEKVQDVKYINTLKFNTLIIKV